MPEATPKVPNPRVRPNSKPNTIQSSEQVRNRENQRRLRERRKEYAEALERKLRVLERDGVHATEIVQKAARRVVEENRLLRELLHERGVTDTAIEEYTRRRLAPEESERHRWQRLPQAGLVRSQPSSPSEALSLQALDRSRGGKPTSPAPCSRVTVAADISQPVDEVVAFPSGCNEDPSGESISRAASLKAQRNGTSRAQTSTTTGHTAQSESRKRINVDETGCEEAARIIASMRGGDRPEDIWPELGCSYTKRTSVKNVLLMNLAG